MFGCDQADQIVFPFLIYKWFFKWLNANIFLLGS